jgi:hypothetical protein
VSTVRLVSHCGVLEPNQSELECCVTTFRLFRHFSASRRRCYKLSHIRR